MEKLIGFDNAVNLKQVTSIYSQVDDNYLFCHIRPGESNLSKLLDPEPMKIEGTMLILMRKGTKINVEVNLEQYVLREGSLLLIFPGNVVRTIGDVPTDIDAYTLYFDTKFSQGVNISLTSVAMPSTVDKPRAVMQLDTNEMKLLSQYFMLIHSSTMGDANYQIKKSIASSLTAAMFYQLVLFYHKRISEEITLGAKQKKKPRRSNDYVREFIRLVHLNYMRERTVVYYAERLFISPKYLSLLVKQATGRSAASWIDQFVIMEAKNMLRFSGKNIQQVAYALNFSTQSSFGKYFKHLTGLSPSEYQKGG